jgi:hypothetical protein
MMDFQLIFCESDKKIDGNFNSICQEFSGRKGNSSEFFCEINWIGNHYLLSK